MYTSRYGSAVTAGLDEGPVVRLSSPLKYGKNRGLNWGLAAVEIRPITLDFSQPVSGSGPRTNSQTLVFPRQVLRAVAGLSGYFAEYSGNDDHNLGQLTVQVDTAINANTVTVTGTLGLRDWSGNWDDQYDGNIECVVLADLEDPSQQPPRDDLEITGAELNQAVQYFRASSYLDPASVMPDNSIWLVTRKNTGVRVYVDYEPDGVLPAITNLTGSLIVQNGPTTVTLEPINPGQAITPRRDSEINVVVADQTLNFMIPASLCTGVIDISCTVWDQADTTMRPSPLFSRTLTFTAVAPMSLYLVGVEYTAVNPSVAAPTHAAISNSLSELIKPVPDGRSDRNRIYNARVQRDRDRQPGKGLWRRIQRPPVPP